MPVFLLSDRIAFPPPELSQEDGLLAIGGDLSEKRLLRAYSMGIFPWYSEGSPILWWSPDPRLVLLPDEMKVSRSLQQVLKKGVFTVTTDRVFDEVIRNCAKIHQKKQGGTWITDDMMRAYLRLHDSGFAHSVESWYGGELVGGLYGVALGAAFFGESMFTKMSNASKVAFVTLVRQLAKWGFTLIDCQIATGHLMTFGAREIPRSEFLWLLGRALEKGTRADKWANESIIQ